MGKNYVENSLKRFLKKKVKITLGFVVAFMITGVVSFGAETSTEILPKYIFKTSDNQNDIEKNKVVITDIPVGYEHRVFDGDMEVILDENTVTYDFFRAKINGRLTDSSAYYILNGAKVKNYGKVLAEIGYAKNPTIYIQNHSEYENHGYQESRFRVIDNSIYRNYGNIIFSAGNTSYLENQSKFYNYGYFLGSADTVALHKNSDAINYGIIQAHSSRIISTHSSGGTFTNYGVLIGANNIIFSTKEKVESTNYGISISINGAGDLTSLFATNNRGSGFTKNGDKYILQNSGSGIIEDTAKKYGTVLDLVKHFEDNNITEKVLNSINITQTVNNGSLTKEADNIYINNSSFKLDLGKDIADNSNDNKADKLIENKAITTIYQGGGNGVVLDNDIEGNNRGDNDLTLKDTTIVGYFEKEGTLLKVDGDLTLNNSVINAVAKRNEDGSFAVNEKEVVAVEVNGILNYKEGESYIFGEIKGGKGSVINVDGNNNPKEVNVLNEQISTSGTVNLNDGNWTKGEFGNINLEGDTSIVNVDGNLVGELMGDSSSTQTTLDGMITGKGTLNVDKIRFNLGSVDINSLDDEFTIKGNEEITLGDKEKANALDKIDTSVIFNKEITSEGNVVLTFKSAEEMGIYDPAKQKEYEQLVINFKDNYTLVNSGTIEDILNKLEVIDKVMALMGTSGVKITRDIAGAFTDSVNEFDKKANKGEWLTNAKYIGSDMEYDGTSTVNGYESDINSMVGMAEYGISDNTSLGFAVGGGDTDIDLKELNGKSTSLDGHNYYAGVYAKHSVNGFDMTGSFGYTISNLDVENGGSADSEAFTLAGYIKRDINLTDTIKLQPNLAFAYDYIKQDTAEMGKGMSINSGDYHIFEADMGMNIVKEIAFENGNLELKAGIKYSMTNVERNKEITGKYYAADVNLGSPEIDDKKGTAHIGFDYEHETGFGVNGKYETMWSDSGDDSRITAGVSYRF